MIKLEEEHKKLLAIIKDIANIPSLIKLPADILPDELKTQLIGLIKERSRLSSVYGERHPRIRSINEAINELMETIKQVISGKEMALNRELMAKKNIYNRLKQLKDQEEQRLAELSNLNKEFEELSIDLEDKKRIYEYILKRYQEAELENTQDAINITLLDRARPPEKPFDPHRKTLLLLAAFLGLLGSFGIIIILDRFDKRVLTPHDITENFGYPLLAFIPKKKKLGMSNILDLENDFTESFIQLKNNLLFMYKGRINSILVTSCKPKEGKSTVSFMTALLFARMGKKVILVDFDLRKPDIHNILNTNKMPGMFDVLNNSMDLKNTIQKSVVCENLFVLPSGKVESNELQKLFEPEKIKGFLESVKENFDLIVFDTPPLMEVSDALLLLPHVDGFIMTTRYQYTRIVDLFDIMDRVQNAKDKLFGFVLNMVELRHNYYYRYYRYGYSYYYRKKDNQSL